MKKLKLLIILTLITFFTQTSYSEVPYFIDFKYILKESDAVKKAQNFLKNKLDTGEKSLKAKEKNIQKEAKKLIQQNKIL